MTGDRIETAEDLDALPVGSVVVDASRYTYMRTSLYARSAVLAEPWVCMCDDRWSSSDLLDEASSPVTLLYRPDAPQPAPVTDQRTDIEALADEAARKIIRWGVDEARERDAMYEEATSIVIEHDLPDDEIKALAVAIEASIGAILSAHPTVDAVKEGTQPGCDGSDTCPAPAHVHGCYADLLGHCDEPGEHPTVESAGVERCPHGWPTTCNRCSEAVSGEPGPAVFTTEEASDDARQQDREDVRFWVNGVLEEGYVMSEGIDALLDRLAPTTVTTEQVGLAWHDAVCPQADECPDRALHAASQTIVTFMPKFLAALGIEVSPDA